jgi:hypothetical protein
MPDTIDAVIKQTESINKLQKQLQIDGDANERRYEHMFATYSLMKLINTMLVYFYLFLFTVIHVLFFEQYLRGIPRSEFWDSIWLTVFFLYPYLIFFIEYYIYEGFMYVVSIIYAQVYVPGDFDMIMTGTDMYKDPKQDEGVYNT